MSTVVLILVLQAAAGGLSAQMGVKVEPDTVTVGEPFTVTVRVRPPAGAEVHFGVGPDTTGGAAAPIQLMAPRADRVSSSLPREYTVSYRLTAWDVGVQPVRIPDVRLGSPTGTGFLDLSRTSVFVRSVLPPDTTKHVPKPARPKLEIPKRNWWPLILLAIAIAAGELLWLVWKRRRARQQAPIDPHDAAMAEFGRIESLGLVARGEPERHLALMVDTMRRYLSARVIEARLSLTTAELRDALAGSSFADDRLLPLLSEADVVKFARGEATAGRATEAGVAAKAIVADAEKRFREQMQRRAA